MPKATFVALLALAGAWAFLGAQSIAFAAIVVGVAGSQAVLESLHAGRVRGAARERLRALRRWRLARRDLRQLKPKS